MPIGVLDSRLAIGQSALVRTRREPVTLSRRQMRVRVLGSGLVVVVLSCGCASDATTAPPAPNTPSPSTTTPSTSTASVTTEASTSARSASLGFLSVPTMDGGAFVADGHNLTVGIAVHDPSTALPQDTTNDVSVISVGREQFGALEDLVTGDEIYWKPTGANVETLFAVTSVRSYDRHIDPATTTRNGLVIVTDPANPKSGQQIVITALQPTDPTTTDTTTR